MYTVGGKAYVSDRTGSGHSEPSVDGTQQVSIYTGDLPFNVTTSPSLTRVYNIVRPLKVQSPNFQVTDTEIDFLWATSNYAPSSANGQIRIHDSYGTGRINLLDDTAVGASGDSISKTTVYSHGILMVVAWAFIVPGAVFTARYAKHRLGIWWFRVHYGLTVLAVILSLVAAGIMIAGYEFEPFGGVHNSIGSIIIIGSIGQVILGVLIDQWFDPNRKSIPVIDKVHWWLGRFMAVASVVTIFLGIAEAKEHLAQVTWFLIYAAVVLLTLILFWVGHRKTGGQQHHKSSDQFEILPIQQQQQQ